MSCNRFSPLYRVLAIITLVMSAVSCGQGDGPKAVVNQSAPSAQDYVLVWSDEFNQGSAPDVKNWRMETGYGDGGWGNDEWQLYTDSPDNVRVEGGNLVITALCSSASTAPAECNNGGTAARTGIITSARINSKDKVEIKYGKIQARIKVPPGKGTWPAFWMLGSVFPEQPWPGAGEIDIVEIHQFYSDINTTHFAMHWCDDARVTPPVICDVTNGRTLVEENKTFDTALSDDYHIYEAEWDENRILGKIDGITYFSKTIDPATEEEFLGSFFMILNIAVGGTLGGPPNTSTSWPQQMLVDWVKVYKKPTPEIIELIEENPAGGVKAYIEIINSVIFGGDSVVADLTSKDVKPLVGETVLELDYRTGNTFFSGGAFRFNRIDLTDYSKIVFSLDFSAFTELKDGDISIEMQDNRFTGDGAPGKVSLPLSNYTPTVSANWSTYEIPLSDFNGVNLDNVVLWGFWNPKNSAGQLIAGKLYIDNILFVKETCTANGSVNLNADSYPANALSAQISLVDTCLANKTIVALVDNGTETIGVGMTVDASGAGSATLNFGPTKDATSTIAINEGDVLTVTYTDAKGIDQIDTASITALPSVSTLGVYSETFINPVLAYFEIINVADFGGKNTVTSEISTAVTPLDGSFVLSADYLSTGTGGDYNGFVFNFGSALVNTTFETDDASTGNVAGATGWDTFEFVFTNNTAGPGFGPVSHDAGGFQSLTMYGPFTFDSASGAYQADDSVVAGKTYTATAHVMNWDGDNLAPDNIGIFQLSFWNAAGGQLGGGTRLGVTELIVDASNDGNRIYLPGQDGADISDWTELSITEIAPAGTVSAELFLLHIQLSTPAAGGSIFWDDVSLKPVPSNDITTYTTLKFGINTTDAIPALMDLEVKMEDSSGGAASVYLSAYSPTASTIAGWNLYEIPLSDFAGLDQTDVNFLGFWNASSTPSAPPGGSVTLLDGTLYFDDIHFSQ